MADLQFSAAIDDTRFVRQLNDMETQAKRAAGPVNVAFRGWGSSINSATGGVRKFTASISGSVGAVTSMLGVWGLVAGTIAGAYGVLTTFERQQREAELAAKREADQRERVLHSLERELDQRRAILGTTTALESRLAAIEAENRALNEQLTTEGKLNEAMQRRATLVEKIAQLSAVPEANRSGDRDALIYGRDMGPGRVERMQAELAALERQIALAEQRRREIESTGGALAEQARQRGIDSGLREQARLEAELARARGDDVEALRMQERIAHEDRLRRIAEIESAGAGNAERLRALEDDLHNRRMQNIETEAAARAQAEQERAAMEERRQRAEGRRREFDERSLDIEIMRLRGMENAAREAEVRLDIERRIRELQDDPSRSIREQQRIRDKLLELESLRLAEIGGDPFGGETGARAIQGALLTGAERQVFGTRDPATERFLARQDQANRIFESIKSLLDGVRGAQGLRVEGDFGARLN